MPQQRSHAHKKGPARRAFTLTELLVSIGVISVLLAISVGALRGVRGTSMSTVSLNNLRGIGHVFGWYTQANRDQYPFPPTSADEPGTYGPLYFDPPGSTPTANHYYSVLWPYMAYIWPALMHDVAPWTEHYASWLSPGKRLPDPDRPAWVQGVHTSYHYSNSFIASPRVWSGDTTVTNADVGPVRTPMVSHPSSKVLVFDAERSYLLPDDAPKHPRPVLFADGSASLRHDEAARPPAPNPLNNNSRRRYHDTPNGVQGQDF
ncbi:MAG: type II secretion system protein [Phycisphaerales bacterium]|nr:MAG: type II secretion system protein [Phycisphaerales bacterium]